MAIRAAWSGSLHCLANAVWERLCGLWVECIFITGSKRNRQEKLRFGEMRMRVEWHHPQFPNTRVQPQTPLMFLRFFPLLSYFGAFEWVSCASNDIMLGDGYRNSLVCWHNSQMCWQINSNTRKYIYFVHLTLSESLTNCISHIC